jgi:DNA-nicking Smr family endonuclease
MNIGDRVRLLRGKEEGIITNFLNDKLIEIEIEDGFKIPVVKNEIVVIASEEARFFKEERTSQEEFTPRQNLPFSSSGLFLAFVEINDRILSLHLINNTDLHIPFSIGQENGDYVKGISAGVLKERSNLKIIDFEVKDFENWPYLYVQALFHSNSIMTAKVPLNRRIKFKAATFYKSKRKAPVLDKEAYVFQLDEQLKPIDPEKIKESLMSNVEKAPETTYKKSRPSEKVDLHIEKLTSDTGGMSNSQKLQLQLEVFEDSLDKAIAFGLDQIIFIHGIGNGVLRNEIHKRLSQNVHIKYFEDNMKEKFGYGATLVKIK